MLFSGESNSSVVLTCFHTLFAAVNTSWFIWLWLVFFSPPDIITHRYMIITEFEWTEPVPYPMRFVRSFVVFAISRKYKTKKRKKRYKAMALKTNMMMPANGVFSLSLQLNASRLYSMNLTKSRCHCCYLV